MYKYANRNEPIISSHFQYTPFVRVFSAQSFAKKCHSIIYLFNIIHIVCVCVCVCVCVGMFMWFMRTQICIMTWVWHRYYKEKVIYEDISVSP